MSTKELVKQLSLQEKAELITGKDFWYLKSIEKLNIPSIMVTDGPHGLRKQKSSTDHLGIYDSVPSICYPPSTALASTWDKDLLFKIGEHLGEECQSENVSILLGPGVNIKRSPLCGRNFEYFSEDPILTGHLAASYVRGVQSKGVGTSVKHFAANNQETNRMSVSAEVDERTLREIYLRAFEIVVREAQPWTIMGAYNRLNGVYCCESRWLMEEILRDEWGFEGFVVSDWGAVHDIVTSLYAGLDLQMPAVANSPSKIVKAVEEGELEEKELDTAVERILNIVLRSIELKNKDATYDRDAHHNFAKEAAKDCIVLLKNEKNTLPIDPKNVKSIGVVGSFAKEPRYQGGGSSRVQVTKLSNAFEVITRLAKNSQVLYAPGYDVDKDDIELELIDEAVEVAKESEAVLLFTGLPEHYESEGFDRIHMELPESHKLLIHEISKVNNNIVIVLSNGAAVRMDSWIDKVNSVLETWLLGQAGGSAVAEIIFGLSSPNGKLAETIPYDVKHNPSQLNFPGDSRQVEYKEGIFVGYRYYDAKGIEPLYPFGYGLSYTDFDYLDLEVEKAEMNDSETIKVKCKICNVGNYTGKEIVQLYVKDEISTAIRPEKELKAFEKVTLEPGQTKEVNFTLSFRDFAYYDVNLKVWYVETGNFTIQIGKSSRDIILEDTILVKATKEIPVVFHQFSTLGEIMTHPKGREKIVEFMKDFQGIQDMSESKMIQEMLKSLPLCKLSALNPMITEDMVQNLLNIVNNLD